MLVRCEFGVTWLGWSETQAVRPAEALVEPVVQQGLDGGVGVRAQRKSTGTDCPQVLYAIAFPEAHSASVGYFAPSLIACAWRATNGWRDETTRAGKVPPNAFEMRTQSG